MLRTQQEIIANQHNSRDSYCLKDGYDIWKEKTKKSLKEKAKQKISNKPKRQQLYHIYRTIMNRRNFEYSLRHLMSFFIKFRMCRKIDNLRQGNAKRDLYLNRAIKKLKNGLSVTKLLSVAQMVEENR